MLLHQPSLRQLLQCHLLVVLLTPIFKQHEPPVVALIVHFSLPNAAQHQPTLVADDKLRDAIPQQPVVINDALCCH